MFVIWLILILNYLLNQLTIVEPPHLNRQELSQSKKFEINTLTPCQPAMSPTARRKSEERVISVSEWLRFCGEVRMAEEAPVATENTSAVVSTCFTWENEKYQS